MASSLVLPTDNAVIDYSIISQMIAVINNQQKQIDTLRSNVVTDSVTGVETVPVTVGLNISIPGDGKTFTFTKGSTNSTIEGTAANLGLSKITAIVGSVRSGATARYCWVTTMDGTNFKFTFSGLMTSGSLYIIAYGIK
jgi:hypothetical protein